MIINLRTLMLLQKSICPLTGLRTNQNTQKYGLILERKTGHPSCFIITLVLQLPALFLNIHPCLPLQPEGFCLLGSRVQSLSDRVDCRRVS